MSLAKTGLGALGLLVLLAPLARAQAVAFQPVVGSFPQGATMSATPVVSADRRYVRLTLNPQFTGLEGFDNYAVPAAVSGGTANVGGGAGGLLGFAGVNGPMAGPGMPMPTPYPAASVPARADGAVAGGMSSDPFQAALARTGDSAVDSAPTPQPQPRTVAKKGTTRRAPVTTRTKTKRRP